jgi:transcriptional regulator NrdR family protein
MLSKDVLLLSPVIDDKEIMEIPKRWQCEHCHEHYAEFEEVLPLPTPLLAPT